MLWQCNNNATPMLQKGHGYVVVVEALVVEAMMIIWNSFNNIVVYNISFCQALFMSLTDMAVSYFRSIMLRLLPEVYLYVTCFLFMTRSRSNTDQYNPLPLCKKASNHHANLPLEMYSFTL